MLQSAHMLSAPPFLHLRRNDLFEDDNMPVETIGVPSLTSFHSKIFSVWAYISVACGDIPF